MNLSLWVSYSDHSAGALWAYFVTSLWFDVAHVVGSVLFCLAFGPALVRALSRYRTRFEVRWLAVPALLGSVAVGVAGAAIVFWLMAHVLWSPNENMQSADYEMVGTLGTLTQPIRSGGIGELVYVQGGSRKSCGARSEDGAAIDKGSEVVVTGYERGIASVRRWSDLAEGH
jgi:membrane-bound ClpP family serine protease